MVILEPRQVIRNIHSHRKGQFRLGQQSVTYNKLKDFDCITPILCRYVTYECVPVFNCIFMCFEDCELIPCKNNICYDIHCLTVFWSDVNSGEVG